MRASILILLSILASVTAATAAQAADQGQAPGTIAVIGCAEILVPVDAIVWTIDVQAQDRNLAKARAEHEALMGLVRRGASALGLADDVSMDAVRVDKTYEPGENGERGKFKGYQVYSRLVVIQRDLDGAEAFLDSVVVPAGLTARMSWQATGGAAALDSLQAAAMADARNKAAALAAAAGARLGKVYTLSNYATDSAQRTGWEMQMRDRNHNGLARERPCGRLVSAMVFATFHLAQAAAAGGR